ncbi:uracil phosphoribosyltransferase [Pedosphaera parvula]|uniref:Uracil phosphoribosyltransferase n=1 Tax=Pedosphaera parvula (strain Ellin514) TaxID=320771 RepID=B9XGK6_PEDPL|nr:uracil phosphoribosyltransferase [Pedosphaera parvula]EEF61057.1 uracil phosphoribosyltransferase [Pedosphaera parvula Ellin514]
MDKSVTVISHPLVQHNLTRLRDERTEPQEFRRVLSEVAALMIYEATRTFAVEPTTVTTPLARTRGSRLRREVILVPVLRAGLGMLDSILQLIPHARVGFIGLKREEKSLQALFYHQSLPKDLSKFEVILIDPMLATGGSSVAALNLLSELGAKHVRMVNLVAAPEGIRRVRASYPDLPIFTASIDKKLNAKGYIVPGLGDAGDRLFGV